MIGVSFTDDGVDVDDGDDCIDDGAGDGEDYHDDNDEGDAVGDVDDNSVDER